MPLDGSALAASALPIVAWLARRMRASVTLLLIVSDLRGKQASGGGPEQLLEQAA
ncbi:MAG: hypothetical protein ACRDID_02475, partial [Ktedonobacterales bacterium]